MIEQLTEYGRELVEAGFEVWLTKNGFGGGYLQYRDPETGAWGSLQHSDHEGWQHLMPIVPSVKHGSSMWIENASAPFSVHAARQCAQPFNRNYLVGRQANAGDRTWRSDRALALHA